MSHESNEKTLRGHSNSVRSVSFSPDGTKLASGSDNKTIKIWEVEVSTGELLKTLEAVYFFMIKYDQVLYGGPR